MTRQTGGRFVSYVGVLAVLLLLPAVLTAGPYDEPGVVNTEPVAWAVGHRNLVRGPVDIADPYGPKASFGAPENAYGPADCDYLDVVSLGDGGQITMIFNPPITDGPGADFAVFENGFPAAGYLFAELAFVEVSTDGTHFVRFPSVSLTPGPVDGFGSLDPEDVHNLAGKHPGGVVYECEGTPFDLSELSGNSLVIDGTVDLTEIRYVRVVDVVGDGSTFDDADPQHPVYDPYNTPFDKGGFDLQAIGVMHQYEGQGCFIATAAFGSPFATKIDLLRSFRDTYLLKSPLGRKAVHFYYRNAKPWAARIARHESLRALVRILLAPVVGLVWLLLGMP